MAARVLVDTHVLLSATVSDRLLHADARDVFDAWPGKRGVSLCVSGQVLREYLVVATRPVDVNGLGLSLPDALGNVAEFSARCRFLPEGPEVTTRLWELLHEVDCAGKSIHDANLVASALTYAVPSLVTANVADFARFGDLIRVVPLGEDDGG